MAKLVSSVLHMTQESEIRITRPVVLNILCGPDIQIPVFVHCVLCFHGILLEHVEGHSPCEPDIN